MRREYRGTEVDFCGEYHLHKVMVDKEDEKGMRQCCVRCGECRTYMKDSRGRPQPNTDWYLFNMRDFLQSTGWTDQLFRYEYGTPVDATKPHQDGKALERKDN